MFFCANILATQFVFICFHFLPSFGSDICVFLDYLIKGPNGHSLLGFLQSKGLGIPQRVWPAFCVSLEQPVVES